MAVVHPDPQLAGHYLWSGFRLHAIYNADDQTVFIATASLLFLSDKFQFNPEAVSHLPIIPADNRMHGYSPFSPSLDSPTS
jgi:hypothetical protein